MHSSSILASWHLFWFLGSRYSRCACCALRDPACACLPAASFHQLGMHSGLLASILRAWLTFCRPGDHFCFLAYILSCWLPCLLPSMHSTRFTHILAAFFLPSSSMLVSWHLFWFLGSRYSRCACCALRDPACACLPAASFHHLGIHSGLLASILCSWLTFCRPGIQFCFLAYILSC